MKSSLKKARMIVTLSLAAIFAICLSNAVQAATFYHPDGPAILLRSFGPCTNVDGSLLEGSNTSPLYNQAGLLAGKVISTPTTLEFHVRERAERRERESNLVISGLDVVPSWITISESNPLLVIPMNEVSDSNIPSEYFGDQYEMVVFAGRVDDLPSGSGIFESVSSLEFRCVFICLKDSIAGPGMGAPVFSVNRLYVMN